MKWSAPAATYENLQAGDVALLGLCCDYNASYASGPAEAPGKIREAFFQGSQNKFSELAVDFRTASHFKDLGDIDVSNDHQYLAISNLVRQVLEKGARPMILGGDHSITYPVIKAMAEKWPGLNIMHFDAHPDLYPEFNGSRYSNACPFARIMEEGLVNRLVQVGIRTASPMLRAQARLYGVEMYEMKDGNLPDLHFNGPLYISLDMDVLDPAFAPGVSHREPGGFSVREVIEIIHSLQGLIVGADIVEFNPRRDIEEMTAYVAVKLLKEIAGRML
ncbi:agmatinase [Aliiglaciecola sp. CAU 1673]|uniref:agmatinase n=1 Tax=Aliiglaciecola sp. CAU 1673 TaxID=3032595 RepID=UPI0023DB4E1C|nr:agmatinase [Aliiglaciecola sp. CAU 1673]MDF2179093.1 agmatinase [Aliiglaciecola sp. CAU 1673]